MPACPRAPSKSGCYAATRARRDCTTVARDKLGTTHGLVYLYALDGPRVVRRGVRRDLRRARKERDAGRWGVGMVLTLIALVLGVV